MKIKRLISLLLILVLLGGSMPVLAANAGSQQDPLLSRSYVQTWSSGLLARVEETARTAVQTAGRISVRGEPQRCAEDQREARRHDRDRQQGRDTPVRALF